VLLGALANQKLHTQAGRLKRALGSAAGRDQESRWIALSVDSNLIGCTVDFSEIESR
jgi:hypothetical protein